MKSKTTKISRIQEILRQKIRDRALLQSGQPSLYANLPELILDYYADTGCKS